MSLLQEALKRKEDDEAQRKPEAASAEKSPAALPPDDVNNLSAGRREADGKNTFIPQDSPPQSMPVPAPPQSAASQSIRASAPALMLRNEEPLAKPERRKILLLWMIVAAIAILTGLTVAAGFVFFIYRWLPPLKAKIGQQAYQAVKTDTIAAGGTNIVVGQPMPATVAGTEAMPHQFVASDVLVPKPQSDVTTVRTQAVAVTQKAGLNAVQQQASGDIERKPVSAKSRLRRDEPAPAGVKTPRASSPAGRWPALKLTGILRGSGPAESTALINGKMINAGQTIEDVTIVEIQANGVLLKHGSEKRFLRVGATLY